MMLPFSPPLCDFLDLQLAFGQAFVLLVSDKIMHACTEAAKQAVQHRTGYMQPLRRKEIVYLLLSPLKKNPKKRKKIKQTRCAHLEAGAAVLGVLLPAVQQGMPVVQDRPRIPRRGPPAAAAV